MILDKQNMFSEGQAVTASAASTNVIDLGGPDSGRSDLEIFCKVSEAFNNLTSLGVKAQTDSAENFSTAEDLPVAQTLPLASLTLNAEVFKVKLPHGCKRYVRLYYTVTGTAPTTGKITAGLVLDRQANP